MFEDTCYCYLASDMNKQAEELADKCIAREDFDDLRKANFWCIKGDIHNSVEFYETAWELSNKRHARSMRSLGALFVHLKRYDEAAAALKNALDLNHLQPGTWFAHGCASLVCGDYSGAAKSFRRCVTLGIRQYFECSTKNVKNTIISRRGRIWPTRSSKQETNLPRTEAWQKRSNVTIKNGNCGRTF